MMTQIPDNRSTISIPCGTVSLVTGGARSGKSAYAQRRAESLPGPRVFIATAPIIDQEMAERIEQHKRSRQGKGWTTIEEERYVAEAIARQDPAALILVDCLTLWVNNLLYESEKRGGSLSEDGICSRCDELLRVCSERQGPVIFVTNELGLGLVPNSPSSRRYRDLVGRCNQEIAAQAHEVVLLTAGIPLTLKSERRQ